MTMFWSGPEVSPREQRRQARDLLWKRGEIAVEAVENVLSTPTDSPGFDEAQAEAAGNAQRFSEEKAKLVRNEIAIAEIYRILECPQSNYNEILDVTFFEIDQDEKEKNWILIGWSIHPKYCKLDRTTDAFEQLKAAAEALGIRAGWITVIENWDGKTDVLKFKEEIEESFKPPPSPKAKSLLVQPKIHPDKSKSLKELVIRNTSSFNNAKSEAWQITSAERRLVEIHVKTHHLLKDWNYHLYNLTSKENEYPSSTHRTIDGIRTTIALLRHSIDNMDQIMKNLMLKMSFLLKDQVNNDITS